MARGQGNARACAAQPGDLLGLADAIEELMDDADLGDRIAREGRDWVVRERTRMPNGPRYKATCETILGPID